jgi:hypothetical protein
MATAAKADRLLATGKVHAAEGDIYIVQGDSGTYIVTVLRMAQSGEPYTATCTCPRGRAEAPGGAHITSIDGCAHIRAAMKRSRGEA